jgi:hypothetical protein
MMTDNEVYRAMSASLSLIFQRGLEELSAASAESVRAEVAAHEASVEFVVRFAKITSIECWIVRPQERSRLFSVAAAKVELKPN